MSRSHGSCSTRPQLFLRSVHLLALIAVLVVGQPPRLAGQSPTPWEVVATGFSDAVGLAVGPVGVIVVADRQAGRVTQLSAAGGVQWQLSDLDRPAGVAFDPDGSLLITEERGGNVLRRLLSGTVATVATGLFKPRWVAVAPDGTIYVTARSASGGGADGESGLLVLQVSPAGLVRTFAAGFKGLEGVTVAPNGSYVYAAARGLTTDGPGVTTRLVRVPIQANGDPGPLERLTWGDDHVPGGVVLDALGGLGYSTRPGSGSIGTVAKRLPSGTVSQLASDLQQPTGVAYEAAGHLLVVEGSTSGRLLRFRVPASFAIDAPAFTNQSPVTVTGHAPPGALVQVFESSALATAVATATADAAGAFAVPVPLEINSTSTRWFTATTAGGDGLTLPTLSATIVHDNQTPSSAILNPPAETWLRGTATMQGTGDDVGASGLASLAVTLDSTVLSNAPNPDPTQPMTVSVSINTDGVPEGARTLAVTATDRATNISTSTQVLYIDRTPPDTNIVAGPSGTITGSSGTFVVAGSDAQGSPMEFAWRLDDGAWSAYTATTAIGLNTLSIGSHRFDVKARDRAGNEDASPATRSFVVAAGIPLSIDITEPLPGTVITTSFVVVRGTFNSSGRDVAVTVPLSAGAGILQVPGSTAGSTFAVMVPVANGTPTLTVVATDVANGSTAQDQVSVEVDQSADDFPSNFQADPDGGLAPHGVTFAFSLAPEGTVSLDIQGDGTAEFEGASFAALSGIPFMYTQPGVYVPTLRVTSPTGAVSTFQTVVDVYDRTQLDARIQTVWSGFKDALRAGNVAQAVSYIYSGRRAQWQGQLSQVSAAALAGIDTVLSAITLVRVGAGGAEYELIRIEGGQAVSYPVVFVADIDGQWRLLQF